MRQTKILLPILVLPYTVGPCRLLRVPAGSWPFPTLSLWIFPWMLGSILRLPPRCLFPLLPLELRPSPSSERVGGWATHRQANSRRNSLFRSCNHSLMFRPPGLLATLLAPTMDSRPKQTVTFTSGQNAKQLPAKRTGYASRPNGKLTTERLSLSKIHSLVGCSRY